MIAELGRLSGHYGSADDWLQYRAEISLGVLFIRRTASFLLLFYANYRSQPNVD